MITVEIFHNKSGKITGFKAVGHTEDLIVCNTISVILQSGIYGVLDYLNRPLKYTLDRENGITFMKLEGTPTAKTEVILGATITSLIIFSKDFEEVEVLCDGKSINKF